MEELWKKYKGDFNTMTDKEIQVEVSLSESKVDEEMEFIEAYHSWVAAGRPRDDS